MLTERTLTRILERLPALTIGVIGDLFLDRYLDLDARLTEPSLETGLDAYQVVQVRCSPGAAGTVVNNLAALGVGSIPVLALIGDDGEGYELQQALHRLSCVRTEAIFCDDRRRTPTYTKPMLREPGQPARELHRLDIKNRSATPLDLQERLLAALETLWPRVHALLVLDQVSEADCGVITAAVRSRLAALGAAEPAKLILVDSRARIGQFANVSGKPNERECRAATATSAGDILAAAKSLRARLGRHLFCTCGAEGICLVRDDGSSARIAAYPVAGPIDIVGAGDSTSAAIASACAADASPAEAAAFGNLVASITIQQLGTTGTASPAQVWQRWQEIVSGQ